MNGLCRSALLALSLTGLLSGVTLPAWAKVRLEVIPLFGTTVPPMGCLPLAVRLQNEGASAETTLIVDTSSGYGAARRHLFPVSLPAGSQKEILTFPFLPNGSSSVTIQLTGIRPAIEVLLPATSQDNARVVVGIGDEIGGLEFLRTLNATPPTTPGKAGWAPPSYGTPEWFWSYCRPEHIPDRAAAFTGVSVLVLGSGAERLTLAQWQAIRTWVMMGGILFAPGGSAAVYLRHVALADLLPVQNLHTMTWSDWKGLQFTPQTQPPVEATYITAGDEVADAKVLATASNQSPLVLAAFRPYGAGGVVFTAFNLWDKPFRGWQGMPELWRRDVSRFIQQLVSSDWTQNLSSLSTYSQQSQTAPYYAPPPGSSGGPPPGPSGGPPTTPPSASRPMPIKLPGAGSLTFTLLVYFAMVVPFSYLCLKRYRKLDWHWLTGPILALLFVFVVGQSAAGLYRLGNQNNAQAVVTMVSGQRDAYLLGSTTLFLQRAGSYTVDFRDGEAAFANLGGYYSYRGGTGMPLDTLEGAALRVPLRVPNLAFRLLYWSQPVTLPGTIEATVKRQDKRLVLDIGNHLPYPLRDVNMKCSWIAEVNRSNGRKLGASPIRFPEIGPGESRQAAMNLTLVGPSSPGGMPPGGDMPGGKSGMPSAPGAGPGYGGPPGTGPGVPITTQGTPTPNTVRPNPNDAVPPAMLLMTARLDGFDVTPRVSVITKKNSSVTLRVYCPIH